MNTEHCSEASVTFLTSELLGSVVQVMMRETASRVSLEFTKSGASICRVRVSIYFRMATFTWNTQTCQHFVNEFVNVVFTPVHNNHSRLLQAWKSHGLWWITWNEEHLWSCFTKRKTIHQYKSRDNGNRKKKITTVNENCHRLFRNVTTDACPYSPPPPESLNLPPQGAELPPAASQYSARRIIAPPRAHWPGRTGSRLQPARLESRRGATLWGGTILPRYLPCLALACNTSSVQASERERKSTASINGDQEGGPGGSKEKGSRVEVKDGWRRRAGMRNSNFFFCFCKKLSINVPVSCFVLWWWQQLHNNVLMLWWVLWRRNQEFQYCPPPSVFDICKDARCRAK